MGAARLTPVASFWRRRPMLTLLTVAALVIIVATSAYLARALAFDAPDGFWRQKGELVAVEEEPSEGDSLYQAYRVTLTSSAGYSVRGHLRVPRQQGRWPSLVVIGGVETGRMSAELITPAEPYVVLGLDYPWDGPTHLSSLQFLVRVLKIRRAMLLTPSAVLLAVDYLQKRPEVDSSRVVLAGASFGAQLITVAGALDKRARTVLVAYGGGDYAALAKANLKIKPRWLRAPVARVGAWLLDPIEPLHYAGQVSPRRLILINGLTDDRVPRHCVEVLYEAAGEPKRLIWLEAGHISPTNPELIERVLRAASRALSLPELADGPPGVE
jgi:hypothetical protein